MIESDGTPRLAAAYIRVMFNSIEGARVKRTLWFFAGAISIGLAGCNKGGDDDALFPSPWEQAEPSDKMATGGFTAELDSDYPGAGWFQAAGIDARDASRAGIADPGSTWPVLQIEIFGFANPGWHRLELSVASNSWVAGDVPIDGRSATGRLTGADGSVRYLLSGDLHVTRAGLGPGEVVQGWFSDVVLSREVR